MGTRSIMGINWSLFSIIIILGGSITIIIESIPSLANATPPDLRIGALLRANYPNQQALVNMFKKYLDSNDYIFGANGDLQNANLLPGSKIGTWTSLAKIQANAPTLKSKGITILGYDLEQALSPPSELSNPVGSMKSASDTAHKYGLLFVAIPGYPFVTPSYASQFAPFADIFVIQAQGWESTHIGAQSCQQRIGDMSNAIRAANPNTVIIIQLSTMASLGTVSDMEQCTSAISNMIDGVEANYGLTSDQVILLDQYYNWLVNNLPPSKHATGLTLNQVASSRPWGQSLTVLGKLTDIFSSDAGFSGLVTFTTSGGTYIPPVTSNSDGTFASTGTAATTVGSGWTVQAHYAGNSFRTAADSEIRTYSTTAHSSSLTLNISPKTVPRGGSYQVSGTLKDGLTGAAISRAEITFTATSPITIPSTTTDNVGNYVVSGLTAPSTAGTYYITSHFAGSSLYTKQAQTQFLSVTNSLSSSSPTFTNSGVSPITPNIAGPQVVLPLPIPTLASPTTKTTTFGNGISDTNTNNQYTNTQHPLNTQQTPSITTTYNKIQQQQQQQPSFGVSPISQHRYP